MRLLTSPRHCMSTISWDPGLANHHQEIFDAKKVEGRMSDGVTNDTLPAYLINNVARYEIWNPYGSHDAKFEQ